MAVIYTSKRTGEKITYLEGLDKVLKNLNKALKGIEERTVSGVSLALLHVRRRSVELIPRDTSNAAGSCETWVHDGKKIAIHTPPEPEKKPGTTNPGVEEPSEKINGICGGIKFGAYYSTFIHEIPKNYRGGKEYKYLEKPLKEDSDQLVRIIADEAKVK